MVDAKNESFCGVVDFKETIVDIYKIKASKVIFFYPFYTTLHR